MPIYSARFGSHACTPLPEMVFRADNMISAVMECHEKMETVQRKAADAGVELLGEITIESIEEQGIELMDEVGLDRVIAFWKQVVRK